MGARATRAARSAAERKGERVELRTTTEEKRLLAAAAAEEQLDMTAFVLRAAIPAAREVLQGANQIRLSARDSARVLELLEHPPAPAPRLRRAAAAFLANRVALSPATRVEEPTARPPRRARRS